MSIETAVVLGIAAISGILAYLSMQVDREQHGVLQILFLMMSLWTALADLGIISEIIITDATYTVLTPLMNSLMTVFMWGSIFVMFYIIVVFIWNLFMGLRKKHKERENARLGVDPSMGEKYGKQKI